VARGRRDGGVVADGSLAVEGDACVEVGRVVDCVGALPVPPPPHPAVTTVAAVATTAAAPATRLVTIGASYSSAWLVPEEGGGRG
jgi:hypothetical protein